MGYQATCTTTPPGSASFFNTDNWFGFLLPSSTDIAWFGRGFDPQANGYPHTVHFGAFCANLQGTCSTVSTPAGTGSCFDLRIADDSFVFDMGAGNGGCSPTGTAAGTINVSQFLMVGDLKQNGLPGTGTLLVRNGVMNVPYQTLIGFHTGGSGTLNLINPNTRLATGLLVVGVNSSGTMDVSNGAKVTVGEDLRIAQQAGATGLAVFRGSGTQLDVQFAGEVGSTTFGNSEAHGTFQLSEGARALFRQGLRIAGGSHPAVTGDILVSGLGTQLTVGRQPFDNGFLEVGNGVGQATCMVTSGAVCSTSAAVRVGTVTGSHGVLSLDGSSTRMATFSLVVGRLGQGDMELLNGALAQVRDTVFVSSRPGGSGLLTISTGSKLEAVNLLMGRLTGSNGELSVLDPGSQLSLTQSLRVGLLGGTARLNLGAGASITTGTGLVIDTTGTALLAGQITGPVQNAGVITLGPIPGPATRARPSSSLATVVPVNGAFTCTDRGRLVMHIGGTPSAPAVDRLEVSGPVTLAGTLELQFEPGFDVAALTDVTLIAASSVTGAFNQIVAPGNVELIAGPSGLTLRAQPTTGTPPNPGPTRFSLRAIGSVSDPGLEYVVPEGAAGFQVDLFDAAGRRIANLWDGEKPAGRYSAKIRDGGHAVEPGIYFARLTSRLGAVNCRLVVARPM